MTDLSALFRQKALDHYLAMLERGEVIRVAPPSGASLGLLVVAAASTVAFLLWAAG